MNAGNYKLDARLNPGTLTINKAPLSWAVADATSTYGTLAALGAVTLNGLVGGDVVNATTAVAQNGTPVTPAPRTPAGTYQETVTGIEREDDVFIVTTTDARGNTRVREARAVVLAIGYYDLPNYLGIPGEDLPHVSHYYTDAHPYYRRRVVVVGGKNSAAEACLELFRAGAHVTLVHRHATLGDSIKYWVRPDIENRIKEGSVAARFETRVVEIGPTRVTVEGPAGREEIPADAVFLLTGYHPDADLMRKGGIHCDAESLAPDMNPETFETNVPNLFLAGGAIAGRRTGHIFIENGRFHGEKIVAVLTDRLQRG